MEDIVSPAYKSGEEYARKKIYRPKALRTIESKNSRFLNKTRNLASAFIIV
jgi:hypothetical protein